MRQKLLLTLLAFLPATLAAAEAVEVVVKPATAQHFGEVTSLVREKFFNMHETPSADMQKLEKYNISVGRGTMSPFAGSNVLNGTTDEKIRQDADRWIKSLTRQNIEITPDLMKGVILTSHPTPKASAGGKYAFVWKGEGADYTDEAKFAERFFRITFKENGMKLPTYYEPMNEPFVKSNHYDGIEQNRVIKEMCRYHQQVANYLHKAFPNEMKIGGFGGAWPFFEGFNSDFVHWKRRMQLYIDIAGADSDYLSFHIYDGRNMAGGETYRSGSNMEALMDIVEGYTFIKFGTPKPILISEHGMTHNGMVGHPYTRERDWKIIEATNHQTVQFLKRPENLEKVIPFMLVKGLWGKQNGHPYPWVLEHEDGNGGWKPTDLYRYYEFWSDLEGDYVYSNSSEIDVQSVVFVRNNRMQIVLNNLEEDQEVDLSIEKLSKNKINKIKVCSLYGEGGISTISKKAISEKDLASLKLRRGETMIITVEYAKRIKSEEAMCEKRFYATSYLKTIKAGEALEFDLNIDKGKIGEATLKIGIARPTGLSIDPILKVGDKVYPFPADWKGYDQKNRAKEGFFGVVDVVIDPADMKEANKITLTFPSDGGTVSTVGATINYK